MPSDLSLLDPALVLPVNNAHAKETSELDLAGLAKLLGIAWYARGIDRGSTAFLIAFDHRAKYDNPNFAWFKAKYESFVYIDRVVVADSARGRGIARLLYEDLFSAAREAGQGRVVCEVNLDPPNPGSDAFHTAMGFAKVGQAAIHDGAKTVSYLLKSLVSQ